MPLAGLGRRTWGIFLTLCMPGYLPNLFMPGGGKFYPPPYGFLDAILIVWKIQTWNFLTFQMGIYDVF